MALYRNRPNVVDAVQATEPTRVETPEYTILAEPGDWIITSVAGKRVCKPEIFALTYEPVPDDSPR